MSDDEDNSNYRLIFYKICIGIFLFCLTFLFGFLPLKLDKLGKNYKFIGTANAFSGGIFLSISLMHLLPESSIIFREYYHNSIEHEEKSEGHSHFPISYFLAFCGYTLILLIEKIIFDSVISDEKNDQNENRKNINQTHLENKIESNLINNNLEIKGANQSSMKISKNETFKYLNINNNYNITLENIEEENNENKGKSGKEVPKMNFNNGQNSFYNEKLRSLSKTPKIRNKIDSTVRSALLNYNPQENMTNLDEYLADLYREDEIRSEQKFKKIFTTKGRFSSLAKEKFQQFKGLKTDNPQTAPITDLKQKIYRELFEETRPSISDKDQLLLKEESKLFNKRNVTSFLLLLALSVHAFFEGLALGLIDADREIFYVLIAISFHKWVEALSIGINLNKSRIDRDVLMVLVILFSLTTPAGILFGIVLSGMSSLFEAIFLSISAGTFLYISASEVIVEEFSVGGNKVLKFVGFLLGSVIIALFTIFEYL